MKNLFFPRVLLIKPLRKLLTHDYAKQININKERNKIKHDQYKYVNEKQR